MRKTCTGCKKSKGPQNYYVSGKGKIYTKCKECHKDLCRNWVKSNKERHREFANNWKANNKESDTAARKAYRLANKEKIAARRKAYYLANKDKIDARNQARYAAKKAERQAAKMMAAADSMKTCKKCAVSKPKIEFYPRSQSRGGLNARCKTCHLEVCYAWAAKNHEKQLENMANWRKANPGYFKQYAKENRAKISARAAERKKERASQAV